MGCEMTDKQSRGPASAERCPACGAHRVAMVPLPDIDVMGFQPYTDLLMMGDRPAPMQPAIACLACGAEWPDLEAFRAASR
jgi:hypothetical protein